MGLGYARWLQNIIRIHRNMFWDHLTLPNIGNSISNLQISTLGTTIGPQNLPFRPGFSQETFWILDYWLFIDNYSSIIIHQSSNINLRIFSTTTELFLPSAPALYYFGVRPFGIWRGSVSVYTYIYILHDCSRWCFTCAFLHSCFCCGHARQVCRGCMRSQDFRDGN